MLFWNNAPYHKGPNVRASLSRKNCCPHLNPIKRLWAVMHSHVTHNRHYPTQRHFANAILNFIREATSKKWLGFRDQATDNFPFISHQNVQILKYDEYKKEFLYI